MLGFKGPRKMTVLIPSMDASDKRIPVQPKVVCILNFGGNSSKGFLYLHAVNSKNISLFTEFTVHIMSS